MNSEHKWKAHGLADKPISYRIYQKNGCPNCGEKQGYVSVSTPNEVVFICANCNLAYIVLKEEIPETE